MKRTLFRQVSAAVLIYATLVGSLSAQNIIVCGGGVYCEQLRLECLAKGSAPALCERQWRLCVLDACPQR